MQQPNPAQQLNPSPPKFLARKCLLTAGCHQGEILSWGQSQLWGIPQVLGPLLYSCGQEAGSCGHLCSWRWPLHLTIAPFLWHPRVSEMRVLSPLFADPYLVRNCSGLKEVFFIGWGVGREAPPYALCFHDQGIERSEETPILGPSHTALIVALSIGQEETMSSWCLISFPFWGGLVTPDNGHGASFWHGVLPTHHLSPLQDCRVGPWCC